jgi:hypothetical protein
LHRTLVAGALLAVLLLVLLGGSGGTGTAQASHSGGRHAVVIRSGQTLWDLARRYAPGDMDPRAYVDTIVQLNHLTGMPAAGTKIRLPR